MVIKFTSTPLGSEFESQQGQVGEEREDFLQNRIRIHGGHLPNVNNLCARRSELVGRSACIASQICLPRSNPHTSFLISGPTTTTTMVKKIATIRPHSQCLHTQNPALIPPWSSWDRGPLGFGPGGCQGDGPEQGNKLGGPECKAAACSSVV